MLLTFLKLATDGQHASLREIAGEMGISESLAADIAEKLVQLGYLQAVGNACGDSACAECPVGGACLTGGRRGYMLTEKGSRKNRD